MKRALTISLLLFSFFINKGFAQTFPVQASTTIVPPYSTYLADYVAPGSERLALNIFLADVNRPELRTRLRLRIEGQGMLIETKPEYLPPPLILQGGVPERLIATDLADYFLPGNLNFQGITRQQFERTGQLPEGLYQFCFEVLEYNRGVKVSNSACTMAWLILNDPPIINFPRQGEKLRPQDPQYITFQWTPRHTGSPNSAFSTEYEFSLVELWPETRNPNDAILTTPPIFETTTQSTTLIYGPAETPLVLGRSYAFRVRAKAMTGIDELDLFKNQGYSEAIGFIYGDACTLPVNITAEAVNSGKFSVSWEPNVNHTNLGIRYRKANDPQAEWYEETTYIQDLSVSGLQAETVYEYQVLAGCGPFFSEYSPIASITTEALPDVNYSCGLPLEQISLANNQPIASLNVGDVILAGDFTVKITEITAGGDRFTGKGSAKVPFLDDLTVNVKFQNISVNEEYRMYAGYMDVHGIGLDVLPGDVSDFLDELDETLDEIDEVLDDVDDVLDQIDDAINVVDEILDEIDDYLPDDILDEIEDAKTEIAEARNAVKTASTPEAKEQARVELKEAKKKLRDGVKKAIGHYGKVLGELLKVVKEVIQALGKDTKEAIDNLLAKKPETSEDANKAAQDILDDREDVNINGGSGGSSGSVEALEPGSNEEILSDDDIEALRQDPKIAAYMDKLLALEELIKVLNRYEGIYQNVDRWLNESGALEDLLKSLKDRIDADPQLVQKIKSESFDGVFKAKMREIIEQYLFDNKTDN